MLNVTNRGQEQVYLFVNESFDLKNNSLYEPIKKYGLKAFSSMSAKTKVKSGGVTFNING